MIKGKTSSGFEYELDDDVLDDYELLEMLCDVDKGNTSLVVDAVKKLLSPEQEKNLREHARSKKGRVSAKKMIEELGEILASGNTGKNS